MCASLISSLRWIGSFVGAWVVTLATALPADKSSADPPRTAPEIYGQGVRETEKRSPAEELAGFHLPTGFVAELIAAEPTIAKPLNMAFDKQGALWITDTTEYPYPVPAGTPAHDSIKILRDADRDGSFETVTTFADGLNIPIGILPVDDGVICFSIPNIMHLRDIDGDGRCDQRKVVLGPFDTSRDTHGMINAIRRGDDGWIYACHGFNNQSHVTAADGSEIHLISGNTFRFREDGSHVEQFTNGQVNPFGMTSDDWGNWFTADCHSKPVTLLVRGGCYESFGRPHDGLGFVPSVMDHLHGSTAICGISYYLADDFPAEFRNRFYSGNVMTSRINCNRLEIERDRIRLVEQPDFMTSDDPWFRPVDIQLGPDGALYVADFYNKIIGHYEVRLDHPERDRTSGRIWRIAYRGKDAATESAVQTSKRPFEVVKPGSDDQLLSAEHIRELGHANATRRHFALERFDGATLTPAQQQQLRRLATAGAADGADAGLAAGAGQSDALRISAIWALHRLRLDTEEQLLALVEESATSKVLVAVLRAWEDRPPTPHGVERDGLCRAAHAALGSDEPQVALAAAAALGSQGDAADLQRLLAEIAKRPMRGSLPQHAMRIACKRLLQRAEVFEQVLAKWRIKTLAGDQGPAAISLNSPLAAILAGILPAVDTPRAAEALLSYAASTGSSLAADGSTADSSAAGSSAAHREAALRLAAKHMSPEFAEPLVTLLAKLPSGDAQRKDDSLSARSDQQTELASELIKTLRAGHHPVPPTLRELIAAKTNRLVAAIAEELSAGNRDDAWHEPHDKLWQVQVRARQGKVPRAQSRFLSSHSLGEPYVGTLSTSVFRCPKELTFWIVGHDGPPNAPAGGKNRVRLVHAESGEELIAAKPPRNDAAKQVRWDLATWQGQPVRLECIDADSGNAYAWLGVGGFSVAELNPSGIDDAVDALARLIEADLSDSAKDQVERLLDAGALNHTSRARLTAGYAVSQGFTLSKSLIDVALLRGQTAAVKKEIVTDESVERFRQCQELAALLAAHMTLSQQTQLARSLIASIEGRRLLIGLVEDGRIAPDSLRGLKDLLGTAASEPESAKLAELSGVASAAPSQAELATVKRVSEFRLNSFDTAKGKVVYEKNCASCHQLRGLGQLVGPQLDAVGARGAERLAEDVLLPNRNVDKAFRVSSLLLDDDRVIVGLVREAPDGTLQVVGTDGKSQNVDPSSIASRRDTTRSLMPDNFGELLSDQDLADLLQFIMQPQK